MPYLDTPGLRVHYETAGTGKSVAILLHGNFATARWWRPVLERVPKGFTIYAPTLRGFGETRGDARARSMIELAEDIRELARALRLQRFHLIGHSLGGAVALQYALSWPETLRGLDLVAPAPGDGLEAMRSRNDLMGRLMTWTDPGLPGSRFTLAMGMQWSRLLGTFRPSIANALARMMPSADPAAIDFDALLADAAAVEDRTLLDIYEALRRWDVRARLPNLALPVRILAGRRDALVSLASLEALAQALPRAQLDIWDDVGHSPQLENPDAFAAWLARAHATPLTRLRSALSAVAARLRRLVRKRLPA
jgi:branched-chain amino acid transport system permease protein